MILSIINSWSYTFLLWLNPIMGSVLCGITLSISWSVYLHFTDQAQLACSQCHQSFISACIPLYHNIYPMHNNHAHTYHLQYSVYSCYVLILISKISPFRLEIHTYRLRKNMTTFFHTLIIYNIFLVAYFVYILFLLVCDNFLLTPKMERCWNPL